VRAQQGAHFGGEPRILLGGAGEEPLAAVGVQLERLREECADARPVGRQACSSLASQARASAQ
jgi:hypothetical protein